MNTAFKDQVNPQSLASSITYFERSPQAQRRRVLGYVFDLVLLLPLVFFVCFYNLGGTSLHHVDESTHVRVTQEMVKNGDYLHPKVFGVPYYNKPPFKMWLSTIPVKLLGESNFSYRVLDGLCGAAMVLLLYLFSIELFRSRLAGIFSGIALLSCRSLVFVHGIRTGTQDAMLITLIIGAMYLGWRFVKTVVDRPLSMQNETPNPSGWGLALFGGLLIGCAVMTKNVAGFLPLAMLGLFVLLSGHFFTVWRQAKWPLISVVLLALLIPAAYIVPKCLSDMGLCRVMLGQEVVGRMTEGYHNQGNIWFYVKRLVRYRVGVPPELIFAGFAFAGYWIAKYRDRRFLFLSIWAIFPVALFTFIPSRLTWYMAPAFPGMALLAGIVLAQVTTALVKSLRNFDLHSRSTWSGVVAFPLLLGWFGHSIIHNYEFIADKIINPPKERLPFDRITEEVLAQRKLNPSAPLKTVLYRNPDFGRNERLYLDMLPGRTSADSPEELRNSIERKKIGFIIGPASLFREAAGAVPFTGYRYLPPANHRAGWSFMLALGDLPADSNFIAAKRVVDFGAADIPLLYGWASPGTHNGLTVIRSNGPRSALVVAGDRAMHIYGTNHKLNMAIVSPKKNVKFSLVVAVNDSEVARIEHVGRNLGAYSFNVPPQNWILGKNVMSFKFEPSDSSAIGLYEEVAMFNWLVTELNQPQLASNLN